MQDVSDVLVLGRAQRVRAASPGVTWLLPLSPEPEDPWIHAFAEHRWTGPLPLRLEPPQIVRVDGRTGVGLRAVHVDGSIVPYPHVHASVEAAVQRANAILRGYDPPRLRDRAAERVVRQILRQPRPPQPKRPPETDPTA